MKPAALLDKKFAAAAGWMAAMALFSWIGLVHRFAITPAGITTRFGLSSAPAFAAAYLLIALLCLLVPLFNRNRS